MASARSASVSFYVGAGSQYERDELAGVSHLVEHCVFKGSELHPSAADISTAIEGVGGYINAGTDRELTVYYAKVPGPDWETAVDVVVDMVCRPRFDRDELEKERSVILEELAQIEDSPYQLVGELMAEVMWRDTPLGRDIAGTPESVNGIPYEDTVSYWRSQYSPGNTLVSVAGEIDPDAVLARVTALTERWAPAQAEDRRAAPLSTAGDRVAVRIKETEQTQICIGLPTITSRHPDRHALSLMTAMLGDGMSSRLFLKVREELGLVYDIHSSLALMRDSGVMQLSMGVDPENVTQALEATLGELARLRDGVTEEELQRARRLAAGRMLMGMEDTRAVSAWNGGQMLLHEELRSVDEVNEQYQAVEADDVARLANLYLCEDELRLALVGPSGEAEQLQELLRF
ncbi:MAG: pitrilysin family protein [Chloroflexi bacterium]|nr:pitrilysin family protein [Chloroflexota bacterium]